MDYQEILLGAKLLTSSEQARLISELLGRTEEDFLSIRREQLFNKQAFCPYCGGKKYCKNGTDKGSQRFICRQCARTFTEYTGTWLDGLHKKSLVINYIELMIEGASLDNISKRLNINKKTALDWRHKILSSLHQDAGKEMDGIVESDETFFEESEKGNKNLKRPGRKRSHSTKEKKKRGISSNKAAVIGTVNRGGKMNLCLATMGRISKEDIMESIGSAPSQSILCTDGHASYKGFAIDNNMEHIVLRADLKQYVKQGVFHIQNINSVHNRLKKWISGTFWGVSTKYLQNYLGWFRLNEKLKNSVTMLKDFIYETLQDTDARKRYNYIDVSYQWLKSTQI